MRLRRFVTAPFVAVLIAGCGARSAEPSRAGEALTDTPPPTTLIASGDEGDGGPEREAGHVPEATFEVCRTAGSRAEQSSPPSSGAEQSGYLYGPNIVYALSRTDLVVRPTSGQVLEDRSIGSVDGGIISYTPLDLTLGVAQRPARPHRTWRSTIVRPLIPREWASDSPLFDGVAGVRRTVYRQGVSHELADSLDAAIAPDDGEPSPDETWHAAAPELRALTRDEVPADVMPSVETIGIEFVYDGAVPDGSGTIVVRSELGVSVQFSESIGTHLVAVLRPIGAALDVVHVDADGTETVIGTIADTPPGAVAQTALTFTDATRHPTLVVAGHRPPTAAERRLAAALGHDV